jgi:hypothetical protein
LKELNNLKNKNMKYKISLVIKMEKEIEARNREEAFYEVLELERTSEKRVESFRVEDVE